MERIVKRSELRSEDMSDDDIPDAEVMHDLTPFKFVEQTAPQIEQVEDEDEMDFCLFAPTPGKEKDTQPISKIRLKSPTPTNAEPGLENPHRKKSYYFTDPLEPEELQRLASTAVPGRDIQARSCSFCPGSSYPWKVLHIRATKREALVLAKASAVYDDLVAEPSKRKRPGKQARIKSRTKQATIKAAQEQDQKAAELKEIADREKRTRRNREKQAKKRAREKVKKAADGAGNDARDVEDDASSQPG